MTKTQFENILKREYTKVYSTGERNGGTTFYKVQNKHGAVLSVSIPENKYMGIYINVPIKPNNRTGSGLLIEHGDGYIDFIAALGIIRGYKNKYPSFFSRNDRDSVQFLTIEQSVSLHNNILGYKLITE